MRLYELLKEGQRRLEAQKVPDADIDAALLWQHASGMSRMDMLLARDAEIYDAQRQDFDRLIERRCGREPLQYITGVQSFMGFDFEVSPQVLIPRQDTETLVETALELARDKSAVDVLDMCCGSGCIGISFGLLHKESHVVLADVSPHAAALTKRNVDKLCGLRANANKADSASEFCVVSSDLFAEIDGRFDLVLSNPPYIRSDVIDTLMPEVRDFEPILALDGTDDGLYFYRVIADRAREHLKDGGYVVFEIGHDQAEDVRNILVDMHYEDIHVVRDLSGNDRVVYAVYKQTAG